MYICDTNDNESIKRIKDFLRQIIDLYSYQENLPDNFPDEKVDFLRNSLKNRWSIFNLSSDYVQQLLTELFMHDAEFDKKILTSVVGIKEELFIPDRELIVKQNNWEEFVKSIKFKNRFHTKAINLNVLKMFLNYTDSIIEINDQTFYRCRISNKKNLSKHEVSAPHSTIAKAGRLNADWISMLYLSQDEETCIQETRAGFKDEVYIGEFKLKRKIKVADLRNFEDITLNPAGENLLRYYFNRSTLAKISKEFAKPLNNEDKDIHYIPLQFISDFIKSSEIGYDGIMYKSVMNTESDNLVLFNPDIAECLTVKKKVISKVSYEFESNNTSLRRLK